MFFKNFFEKNKCYPSNNFPQQDLNIATLTLDLATADLFNSHHSSCFPCFGARAFQKSFLAALSDYYNKLELAFITLFKQLPDDIIALICAYVLIDKLPDPQQENMLHISFHFLDDGSFIKKSLIDQHIKFIPKLQWKNKHIIILAEDILKKKFAFPFADFNSTRFIDKKFLLHHQINNKYFFHFIDCIYLQVDYLLSRQQTSINFISSMLYLDDGQPLTFDLHLKSDNFIHYKFAFHLDNILFHGALHASTQPDIIQKNLANYFILCTRTIHTSFKLVSFYMEQRTFS